LDALSIRLEPHDDLAVDHERRRGPALPSVDQFVARVRIGLDILRLIRDAVLPEELLGGAAIPSARLMIKNDLFHVPLLWRLLLLHCTHPVTRTRPPARTSCGISCVSRAGVVSQSMEIYGEPGRSAREIASDATDVG